jgi:branched-subunit amino acid transport protein
MSLWITLILAGLLTYAIRLSFILLLGKTTVPDGIRRSLRFVPPAVLTAIIIPELVMPGGKLDISPGNARLLAGLAAGLVAWRTKNAVLTIAVGMAVLWILMWVLHVGS